MDRKYNDTAWYYTVCPRFHGMGTLYFKDKGKFQAEWSNGRPQGTEGVGVSYTTETNLHKQ